MVVNQRKGARDRARYRINAMLDDMVAASETPQTATFANAACADTEHMRWADDGGRHHD